MERPNESAERLRQNASHPVDEAALLITCLRELPFNLPDDINWRALLTLAQENGVLLLVYRLLFASGAHMPGFFRDAAQECQAVAESLAAALETLLQDFTEHGIEVLPLKGPALALALYGDAALRQSNDIDLLIRRDDFSNAEALLLGQGFAALGVASEHDRRFLHGELLVELHFELASPRFFPFNIDGIWSRSRCADFRGKPAHAMSKGDLVLYLCAHGLKHGFSRLIWILDLSHALQGWEPREYQELMKQAQRHCLRPWLLIGCEVVRAMFPLQLPAALDTVIAQSPVARNRAHCAAARLFTKSSQAMALPFEIPHADLYGLFMGAPPSDQPPADGYPEALSTGGKIRPVESMANPVSFQGQEFWLMHVIALPRLISVRRLSSRFPDTKAML